MIILKSCGRNDNIPLLDYIKLVYAIYIKPYQNMPEIQNFTSSFKPKLFKIYFG